MDCRQVSAPCLIFDGCHQRRADAESTIRLSDVEGKAPQRTWSLATGAADAHGPDRMPVDLRYEQDTMAVEVLLPPIGDLPVTHFRLERGRQLSGIAGFRFSYQEIGVFRVSHSIGLLVEFTVGSANLIDCTDTTLLRGNGAAWRRRHACLVRTGFNRR